MGYRGLVSPHRRDTARLQAKLDLLVEAARVSAHNPTKEAIGELAAAAIEYATTFQDIGRRDGV